MRVGVPRELKNHEYRVAITPAGVHELVRHGHQVLIEGGAGIGSSIGDGDFAAAGARIVPDAEEVWGAAEMVLKVKEPIAEEYHRLRRDLVLFTYLHLAASKECTDALVLAGTTAIAYETVQLADGSLPLLYPMSEVAGRLAPLAGAYHLMRAGGGRGVLMGGVSGVYAAKVVVIGAGVAGMNAAAIAMGMQSEVLLLDRNIDKLREADRIYQGRAQTVASNTYEIEKAVVDADLVVGAVLVPGAVPHTSTYALTNVTLPYALAIADRGWRAASRADHALALGLNTHAGAVVCEPVARAHGMAVADLNGVLGEDGRG
ncbi:MAG TPA: alanine dehydrogenase [Micromonosporaceae bacterium]